MKLLELKQHLQQVQNLIIHQTDGQLVPPHFHVTEVGKIQKEFIDCGGTVRTETVVSLQLWSANDYNHRLHPEKLIHILELSEKKLGIPNLEVEVEYQTQTIGKYDLTFDGNEFHLVAKNTDCLAKDNCGIPAEKITVNADSNCCTPGGGCC